jgi:hypothetical protein
VHALIVVTTIIEDLDQSPNVIIAESMVMLYRIVQKRSSSAKTVDTMVMKKKIVRKRKLIKGKVTSITIKKMIRKRIKMDIGDILEKV